MKYNLSEAEYEIMKFIWEQGDNIGFNDIMEYTQKKGHTWKKQTVQTNTASFDEILFSKHASKRLETRQIDMSADQKERLLEATCKAKAKGMKESLVMVDDFAFIVNVKNNLVITAVNDTKNAVFTNIDGAIIN